MLRDYWRDPRFWMWWWRERVPVDARIGAAVVGISLLAFGGYAAAGGLNGAVTASSSEPRAAQVRTVRRLVTIRESGQVVTKPVRVVRTIPGRGSTSYETQVLLNTVTIPGDTFVVTRREVRTVPVVRRVVVTRDGRVQTVVQTQPGTTQTHTSVVTDQRTVTNERVVTQSVTITRIVTDTIQRTETVTMPVTFVETVPITITVTLP